MQSTGSQQGRAKDNTFMLQGHGVVSSCVPAEKKLNGNLKARTHERFVDPHRARPLPVLHLVLACRDRVETWWPSPNQPVTAAAACAPFDRRRWCCDQRSGSLDLDLDLQRLDWIRHNKHKYVGIIRSVTRVLVYDTDTLLARSTRTASTQVCQLRLQRAISRKQKELLNGARTEQWVQLVADIANEVTEAADPGGTASASRRPKCLAPRYFSYLAGRNTLYRTKKNDASSIRMSIHLSVVAFPVNLAVLCVYFESVPVQTPSSQANFMKLHEGVILPHTSSIDTLGVARSDDSLIHKQAETDALPYDRMADNAGPENTRLVQVFGTKDGQLGERSCGLSEFVIMLLCLEETISEVQDVPAPYLLLQEPARIVQLHPGPPDCILRYSAPGVLAIDSA
ncbi:hypothetical protein BDY19DRAFT_901743 [Irpex rosettiformis]|uniref:Uncharacterized protein n=1 Tax=Irpex rosettiformis TaxID=378272 RepID=A0ACB8UJU1_9APHY|nr:hypothetical protein BDY19DRAFT_901743 [Irpex rosettiformis]